MAFKTNIFNRKWTVVAILLVASLRMYAVQEHFYNSISGANFATNSSVKVQDDKFPTFTGVQENIDAVDVITLQVNEDTTIFAKQPKVCEVFVQIKYWDVNNVSHILMKSLTIHMDMTSSNPFNYRTSFKFKGGYKVKTKILSVQINGVTTTSFKKLYTLSEDIYVNRIYNFDCTIPLAPLNSTYDNVNQRLKIGWATIPGADEYDLEWTFYDSLSTLVNQNIYPTVGSATYTDFDFIYRSNATRVTVNDNEYPISLVYNHGYIFYRVRGIHYDIAGHRIEGAWSSIVLSAQTISAFPDKFDWSGHEHPLNWQYTAAYAEQGKRKEVASYFDGSLRNRQSVTLNNTNNQAIVGENIYDHQGRLAIKTLPAPIDSGKIVFYDKYNVDALGSEYNRNDFDTSSCGYVPLSMDSIGGRGSSGYYSSSNSDKTIGFNAYLPDAQGYPFTETEYTPDNTGRISSQSIAGKTFTLGSGHETKYFYGKPAQEELDRLFGNEVGDNSHYLENMVQDANGQISVSYVDANGKTVATALAGKPPTNVQALPSYYPANTLKINLLDSASNTQPSTTQEMSTYSLLATNAGDYHFTYKLLPGKYDDNTCSKSNFCDDCLYDAMLSITDNCGGDSPLIVRFDSNFTQTQPYDSVCGTTNNMINLTDTFTVFLTPGTYNITRLVSIDQGALRFYTAQYLKSDSCSKSYNSFLNNAIANTDFSGCDMTCSTCLASVGTKSNFVTKYLHQLITGSGTPTAQDTANADTLYNHALAACNQLCNAMSPCDDLYQEMLEDMSLGGQYGLDSISDTNYVPGDATSFLNGEYRTPATPYRDNNGNLDSVLIAGVKYAPQQLTVTDFVNNWQPSWAKSLVTFHPEYCYYTFCQLDSASNRYDAAMENTDSYAAALSAGFINPLGVSGYPIVQKDPFYQTTGHDSLVTAQNIMGKYLTVTVGGTTYLPLSMWKTASMIVTCNIDSLENITSPPCFPPPAFGSGCTADMDREWQIFRGLYQSMKQRQEAILEQTYVSNNGCSQYVSCIGQKVTPCNPNYVKKQPRHITYATAVATTSPPFAPNPVNPSTSATFFSSSLTQNCDSQCVAYAYAWMQDLAGCGLDVHTDSVALISGLVAVCENGCDAGHPFGSSTTPGGTPDANGDASFEDVIERVLGVNPDSALCNGVDISMPPPYNDSNAIAGPPITQTRPPVCACAKLNTLYTKYYYPDSLSGDATYKNFADYLNQHFGGNMGEQDVYTLMNACNDSACAFLPYPMQLPIWVTCCQDTSYMIIAIKPTPTDYVTAKLIDTTATITENTCCINCSDIAAAVSLFNYGYPGADTLPQYTTLIANYLNQTFNFSLTYSQYLTFYQECNGGSIDSITPVNDSVHEIGIDTNIHRIVIDTNIYRIGLTIATPSASGDLFPVSGAKANSLLANPAAAPVGTSVAIIDSLAPATYQFSVLKTAATSSVSRRVMLLVSFHNTKTLWNAGVYNADVASWKWLKCACAKTDSSMSMFTPAVLDTNAKTLHAWIPSAKANALMGMSAFNVDSLIHRIDDSLKIIGIPDSMISPPAQLQLLLCNEPITQTPVPPDTNSCISELLTDAQYNAQNAYNQYEDSLNNAFQTNYIAHCINIDDSFHLVMPFDEYHYTLYYYDQAGNLVKTVPPQGVHAITAQASLDSVTNYRAKTINKPVYPIYDSLTTRYWYNTLNAPQQQVTPDGDTTHFWYDRLGRLVLSQNGVQKYYLYSYTLYDPIGRIKEVGQMQYDSIVPRVAHIAKHLALPISYDTLTVIARNDSRLNAFISRWRHTQITRTYYDSVVFLGIPLAQQNLRKRVSSITYQDTNNISIAQYDNALHFSYDIEGNVETLLSDNPHETQVRQRYKRIDYEYDLVSGKVNEVLYQNDSIDMFLQQYQYDADNRITDVLTSRDSLTWDHDAGYQYYAHGPLAREVIGRRQVQGVDYAYTINGWIKGVNSSITNPSYDMGEDGNVHNPSTLTIGRDAFGFTLNYFIGDYKAIGNSAMEASGLPQTSMYNGNIAAATYSIPSLNPKTIGYSYNYDQLNRYIAMQAYDKVDTVDNNWSTGIAIPDFKENVSYDENGNILTYIRHGNTIGTTTSLAMDSLNYFYNKGTNQLNVVADAVPAANYPSDIDNEAHNNYQYNKIGELAKDNAAGIDTVTWTVYGKIKKVILNNTYSNQDSLVFEYDPMGNRIEKRSYIHYKPHKVNADTTLYSREASGNILAIYTRKQDSVKVSEWDMYGSSRLGTLDTNMYVSSVASPSAPSGPPPPPPPPSPGGPPSPPPAPPTPCCWPPPCSCGDTTGIDSATTAYMEGQKQYELTNHLGNVFVTLSDKKIPVDTVNTPPAIANYYIPLVITSQDYYPFGMLQPGRLFNSTKYHFGFNGKEKTDELYGTGNAYDYGMRMYDPRLGRFMSTDPLFKKYPFLSPYNFVANSPIKFKDDDGMEIVDANGNVAASISKTGQIALTKYATPDIAIVLLAMSKTAIGLQKAQDMVNSANKIQIVINTTEAPDKGTRQGGTTKVAYQVNSEGESDFTKVPDVKITIYLKSINQTKSEKTPSQISGKDVLTNNFSVEEIIGATATHEATHATEAASNRNTIPNKTIEEAEKNPRANELKFYQQIDKEGKNIKDIPAVKK